MAPKLETKSIIGIVAALIVGLMLSPLIISFVSSVQPYDYTTYQTLNYDFSDNTGVVPDNWDNYVEGDNITNAWNSDNYITATRTDNGLIADNYENSNWYQALAVSDIHDGVSSATLAFKYRLIDNENLSKIVLEARLCDGTDNTTIWTDNSVENSASWTSESHSVLDNVSSTGTYTLYLRAEIAPDESGVESSIQVGWDDASLTVVTQTETFTSMMILAYLIPLFFVIGLVLAVVYWATSRS